MIHLIETAHAGVISSAPTFQEVGINVLNFLLSIMGIIAIIMSVISGVLYFFSAGDEERIQTAKKSIKYGVIGILLALSGIIIVRTIAGFLV